MIQRQPRRHLAHTGQGIPVPHDLRISIDQVRQKDIGVLELGREQQPTEQRTHRDSAVTFVRGVALTGRTLIVRVVQFNRRTALGCAHDGVRRRELSEVDAWLFQVKGPHGRDVASEEVWRAVGQRRVVVRRDHAVTMRENGDFIGPVALTIGNTRQVDLAGGDHGASLLVLERVPVDVQASVERVVATDLLQLVVGGRNDRRIEQTYVVQCSGTHLQDFLRRRRDRSRVLLNRCFGDVERIASGFDIAFDEGSLAHQFARTNLELLNDQWVHPTNDHRRKDHQAQPDQRNYPLADEDVDHKQQPDEQGDESHDVQRGQHRVHVGVLQPRETAGKVGTAQHQFVAVQPVRRGLQEKQNCQQRGQLNLRSPRCPIALGLQAQSPIQVLHHHNQTESDECGNECIAEHESKEGQIEGVEGRVHSELWILDPKWSGVAPLQESTPLSGTREATEQAQHDR